MARKNLIRTNQYPYHVYARTNRKEWFRNSMDDIWKIYCDLLYIVSCIYQCEVHAFVLMNNHFHLIVSTPLENLDEAMLYLMRESSREINRLSENSARIYSGRYKWSLINERKYYFTIMKYVYRNPVQVELSKRCEDYKYSSLNMLMGKQSLTIPLAPMYDEDSFLSLPKELSAYCDDAISEDLLGHIKMAIAKPIFKVSTRVKKSSIFEMESMQKVAKSKRIPKGKF